MNQLDNCKNMTRIAESNACHPFTLQFAMLYTLVFALYMQ
uniref:Uncharacterized protein n=1 Tax=Anguilla anguilla TaxID=7936 RepID=A0A0E9W9A0_ANGAN